MLLYYTPVIWFWSVIFMMRGRYDLNGYCPVDQKPEDCKWTYTSREVFNFNYFVWTTAYYLGLQFTHADVGIMQ